MNLSLRHVRRVISQIPQHGKLAYCLVRDPRVPLAPKAALLGTLGIIVSPLDFPAWLPVLGELDMLALGILAVETFVDACPAEVVADNRAALRSGTSTWDDDRKAAVAAGRRGVAQLVQRWRPRLAPRSATRTG